MRYKDEATKSHRSLHDDKFQKRFCETQGYGWYLSEANEQGKLVCEECSDGTGKYNATSKISGLQTTQARVGRLTLERLPLAASR